MLDEFFEEGRAVRLRNALQTSQNHVVAVGVSGEVRDVALQNREKRVDHAGRGAVLRFRLEKVRYLDETLHAARSVDVQRRVDHELADRRELPLNPPSRSTICARRSSLHTWRSIWKT